MADSRKKKKGSGPREVIIMAHEKAISPGAMADLQVPPPDSLGSVKTLGDAQRVFGLPVTLADPEGAGMSPEEIDQRDMAFDHGLAAMADSLVGHAEDLGQFPMTSFVGYGVLQQIAQNGMIRTCIQTVADDCTREWIELTGGDETPQEDLDRLAESMERHKLRKLWADAIATMGYMGGALIYIDTGTDDPSLPLRLSETSDELQPGGKLRFVLVDPVNVTPGMYNATDPLRPDYMTDPEYWIVLTKRVHKTRLIILRDNLPPTLLRPAYNFMGIPQAQILWDYVLHWNRARVSAADILEKLNLMVFQTNTEDLLSQMNGVSQLDAKMLALTRYRSNNAVLVCDRNMEDVKNVTLTISGVTEVVRQALEFIAAINRTPAVKLLGISPSGFNATGESDIRNYYDHIASKQELLRDGIRRAITCLQLHLTGKIDPSISFDFNRLGTDDAAADAQVGATVAQTLSGLLQGNVISAEEARQRVKQDPRMGLDFISDEAPEPNEGADVQGGDELDQLVASFMADHPGPGVAAAPAGGEQDPGETGVPAGGESAVAEVAQA